MKQKILFLFIILFFLTGCYDYKEINDLAIVSAIGISKDTLNDEYIITVQVINTLNHGSETVAISEVPDFFTYTINDKSIFRGVKRISTLSSKKMYYNHFLLLLIDENVAINSFNDILDVFLRETESRKNYSVFISKDNSSKDILKVMTKLQTLNASNIVSSNYINSNSIGTSITKKFEEVMKEYLNKNKEMTIPSIVFDNNNLDFDNTDILKISNYNSIIKIGPTSIFKKDKLIDYLDEKETMCLNIINNNSKNMVYTFENKNNEIMSLELINIKSKIKLNESNKKLILNIDAQAILSEVNFEIDLKNISTIKKYNKIISNSIKKDVINFINNTKYKYELDIIGIKDYLYKYHNNYYNSISHDFFNNYKQIDFDVNVNLKITEKGNTVKEINNEK